MEEKSRVSIADLTAPGAPFEIQRNSKGVLEFVNQPSHMCEILAKAAAEFGECDCLLFKGKRLTYAEVYASVQAYAKGLQTVSKPGDRVAILGKNHPNWILGFWAALYAGLVPVALNGWWSNSELLHGMTITGCSLAIADGQGTVKLLDACAKHPVQIYCWDTCYDTVPNVHAFDTLLSECDAEQSWGPCSPCAPAALLFSSGTTGRPKAVEISHSAWIAALMNAHYDAVQTMLKFPSLKGVADNQRILASLPFFHVGGCHGVVISGMGAGACIVIPEGRFDAAKTLDMIEDSQITRWSAVPAMVQQACNLDDGKYRDLSSLMLLGYGAAPSAEKLQDTAYRLFPNLKAISNAYGMTEASGVFAINSGVELSNRPNSVGRGHVTAELKIVDETLNSLEAGELGEILVRGPFLMTGYWNDPEATLAVFVSDGWLRTGDLGRLDVDGYLYIEGRQKDIIIRGGENILAAEVEKCLEQHPDIVEAAVVPSSHAVLGEEVKAHARLRRGATLTEEQVQEWVGGHLAHFKVPSIVAFCQEPLPRNVAGKLLKQSLLESVT